MECKLRRVRSCLVMKVREVSADDLERKRHELVKAWGSTLVARQGTVIDALTLDGYAAIDGGTKVGLLTYDFKDDAVEVVTIHVEPEGRGIGRGAMDAVKTRAQELGAHRLWLSTTNDNVRAFGFYQQWGMDLAALVRGGVHGLVR